MAQMKYSQTSALHGAMADHMKTDDDQSTSAGGSDSEVDAKECLLDSWEDDCNDSDTTCTIRETECARYERETLLQLRLVVGQTKSCESFPHGKLFNQTKASQPNGRITKPVHSGKAGDRDSCRNSSTPPGVTMPLGITPPPGLSLPTDLEAGEPEAVAQPKVFSAVEFRKELVVILRDLSSNKNVGAAVQRVRDQSVPKSDQAEQYLDILSRSADEKICANRRLFFAFAAGLVKAERSAFEKAECIAGLTMFFQEVYEDWVAEMPRAKSIVAHELLPSLRSAIPEKELSKLLPADVRTLDSRNSTRRVPPRRA